MLVWCVCGQCMCLVQLWYIFPRGYVLHGSMCRLCRVHTSKDITWLLIQSKSKYYLKYVCYVCIICLHRQYLSYDPWVWVCRACVQGICTWVWWEWKWAMEMIVDANAQYLLYMPISIVHKYLGRLHICEKYMCYEKHIDVVSWQNVHLQTQSIYVNQASKLMAIRSTHAGNIFWVVCVFCVLSVLWPWANSL